MGAKTDRRARPSWLYRVQWVNRRGVRDRLDLLAASRGAALLAVTQIHPDVDLASATVKVWQPGPR